MLLVMLMFMLIFVLLEVQICCLVPKSISIAVFVQIGNMNKLNHLMKCVGNVVEAKRVLDVTTDPRMQLAQFVGFNIHIDVHVSFVTSQNNSSDYTAISNRLSQHLYVIDNSYISTVDNEGYDVGQFLSQLRGAEMDRKKYDVVLKVHSKTNKVWANHAQQCLCGTPAHVMSILNQFITRPKLDFIAPQGLVFNSSTAKTSLHPTLIDLYFQKTELSTAFSDANVNNMKSLHQTIFGAELNFPFEKLLCDAGTMFWVRYSALKVVQLTAALPVLSQRWSKGYTRDNGIEHALERLIPTWISRNGGLIGEMPPAPKVLPMYFPQYHAIPENDRFHGKDFTEWTLLRPLKDYFRLMKPLSVEQGGLGYYNLTERAVRRRQAELATLAGVHGFVFSPDWFSGERAPPEHLVMHRVTELLLVEGDGEPALPFMLSWANEPWTRTWAGEEQDVLLSQEYGGREDWVAHFNYLLRFFKHPRYIRVEGKPAIAIYRIGHFGDKLKPILHLWNEMARQNGFPGIHFINTIGNFLHRDRNTLDLWRDTKEIEGCFHFRPQLRDPFSEEIRTASVADLPLALPAGRRAVQYWGAYSSFDPRPRRPTANPARGDLSPELFLSQLRDSFAAMSAGSPARFVSQNLYFVTAWNEWNEQAVLEPDDKNGFAYLLALKIALQTIPARIFVN